MIDELYVVEPLDAGKHNREAFSCGVDSLDAYLKSQATQQRKKNVAVPYVLCRQGSDTIMGYYTLSTTSIEAAQLPDNITSRLPRYPAFPAILIGRLAVDRQYKGQGLGKYLLIEALKQSLEISTRVAVLSVLVDAIDEQAVEFYKHFGFQSFQDKADSLYLPMATIQKAYMA